MTKSPVGNPKGKLTGDFLFDGMITKMLHLMQTGDHRTQDIVLEAKNILEQHKCESSSVDAPGGPNKNNPNLFPIGDGFGLFVFFGSLNAGVRGR